MRTMGTFLSAFFTLFAFSTFSGCSAAPPKSPDVTDSVRSSLDHPYRLQGRFSEPGPRQGRRDPWR